MSKPKLRALLALTGILVATWIAIGQQNRRVDQNTLRNAGKSNTEDWLMYGLNYQEQRYSLLKQIDAKNVGRLGLAWTYEIGQGGGNQEGTPLVYNGILYSITNWSITYAVDVRTGKEIWRYDPNVNRAVTQPKVCCGIVNRGIGIYQDKVYVPVLDGRLIALDIKTGKEVWSVQTTPPDGDYSVTMAPRIAKGKVIIGNAGAEYPVRGYVTAYDAETGKQVWRFYTVPGDPSKGFESKAMEAAAKTWGGEWYKYGGGGTVWDGMTYDPDSNLIYFGTGNGGPWPSEFRQSRGLDNLYVCSVVALNADTGEYKWHYQFVPEDSWDFDSVQQLTLADIRINGQARKVIMQANKNGFFYVLDRLTGKVISASPFAKANWASEIDLRTGRPMIRPEAFYSKDQAVQIFPGPGGAHNWAPMAFNPVTNLMYIPASADSSSTYRLPDSFTYQAGRTNMGITFGFGGGGRGPAPAPNPAATGGIAEPGAAAGAGFAVPTGPAPGANVGPTLPSVGPVDKDGKPYTGSWLIAIDPSTQKEKWRVQGGGSIGGGALTTAGNLVFQTTNNGRLLAYSADTGEKLLDVATNQTGGMGPPITFMVDNKQYVAVAGGSGPRGQRGPGGPGGPGGGPGGPGAAPGAPGAPGGPGVVPPAPAAVPPAPVAPGAAAAGGQRGNAGPGGPAVPAGPSAPAVLPRLYVYMLDGKAENPTPVPPPAPAGGGFGGFGAPGGGPGAPAAPGGPPAPAGGGGRGQ
jgi:quinohemoprotein ethanol dehydrogenase